MMERIWLEVSYGQKDDAKAAGARWDPQARRWYAPRPGMTALDPWQPLPPLPDVLPGEDRTLGSGLFVDLVPASCWFSNARSCLTERDWDRVRQMVIGRAGEVCEVCGARRDATVQRWVEVHERWAYDDTARVQALRRLICLCTDCHKATHFGLAQLQGRDAAARAHLLTVTGMDQPQVARHIADAFAVWRHRSRLTWSLDLRVLTDAGLNPTPPPAPGERRSTGHGAIA